MALEHLLQAQTVRIRRALVAKTRTAANDAQHIQQVAVQNGFLQSAVSKGGKQRIYLHICARHKHIIACLLHTYGIFLCPPIGHHESVESPFATQYIGKQVRVL